MYGTWFLLDGSNVTEHGNKQWKDAMDLCISLNKSLPGIESDLLKSPQSHIANKSLNFICLAVYQNLSIMFLPVIKQIKNKEGNTTVQTTNNTRGLPFLCRVKTGKVRSVKNNGFFQCNNYFETSIEILHWNSGCFCVHVY